MRETKSCNSNAQHQSATENCFLAASSSLVEKRLQIEAIVAANDSSANIKPRVCAYVHLIQWKGANRGKNI